MKEAAELVHRTDQTSALTCLGRIALPLARVCCVLVKVTSLWSSALFASVGRGRRSHPWRCVLAAALAPTGTGLLSSQRQFPHSSATQRVLRLLKNQLGYFCRPRGCLLLYAARGVKRSGSEAAPSAPASTSLQPGRLGARHVEWSKGMLLDFFRKSAGGIVLWLIILSSL